MSYSIILPAEFMHNNACSNRKSHGMKTLTGNAGKIRPPEENLCGRTYGNALKHRFRERGKHRGDSREAHELARLVQSRGNTGDHLFQKSRVNIE